MHRAFFVLIFACCIGFSTLDQQNCHYVYNYACYANRTAIVGSENKTVNSDASCSIENLRDDVKYILKLPKRGSKSIGLLEVKFSLPSTKCNYEVALLVNSSITNEGDCKNVEFRRRGAYEQEIHSEEKNVCVFDATDKLNCTGNEFSMWYRHVFTGCYALRFTVDGYTHAVLGKHFIVTNYTRTEVAEPKFRCHYDDPIDAAGPNKQDLVTFALSVSVHAETAGMILTLISMSFREDIKEDSCVRYSGDALYKWHISTDGIAIPEAAGKNCRMITGEADNETSTRDTECKFDFQSPRNSSYCLEIEIEDDRCSRQTVWSPPPDGQGGKPPCTWLQKCTRIPKNRAIVEYNGLLHGGNETASTVDETGALVPIAVTVVIVILICSSAIFFICHKYLANSAKPIYVKRFYGEKIEQDSCEMDSVESTDVELLKNSIGPSKNKHKNKPIVLLYARGTNSFMNLMMDLRLILETHCSCRVRDWYDASEWDEVARIGPSAWVAHLLRDKYRAVWIDTPRARKILDVQWRNRYLGNSKIWCSDEIDEAVSDFRDAALPTVLETAKRSVTALEYDKHFVVRLSSCDANNDRPWQDPFEDLSPHTRYLISHNLEELCSHLTSSATRPQEQLLNVEQSRLRERVERLEKNAKVLETLH